MKNSDIREILKERILVLDGAMGTMIQDYKLEEEDFRTEALANHSHKLKGNNDLLSLSKPEIIKAIHKAYFDAGADIAETNTFSSTSIAQADYGLEDLAYELNYQSASIAKEVALAYTDKPRWVAGSIGPTNRTASISPDVNNPAFRGINFNQLVAAYETQIQGLIDGGADLLLIETVFDTLNAKAALYAQDKVQQAKGTDLPVMVSGTITDASGRTLSGQTAEAFYISIAHMPLLSVGFNCALGAKQLLPHIQSLSKMSSSYVSAHPNAGLPNEFGEYDESPEAMAAQMEEFVRLGLVNIIGGCCGTTPDHIREIARVASEGKARPLSNQLTQVV